MKTEKIAAIDIGSNSIKLVIAEAAAADLLVPNFEEKESVRLGRETLRARRLSAEAITRAADCIGRFRAIADSRGASTILAVATASVRAADNAAEFIKTVEQKTGVRVEVLSPVEEARLIGVAVANFCGKNTKSLINIDIGGGSTELSLMRDGEPEQLFSMKLGAVGLTERFLANDPPTDKDLRELRQHIAGALERPVREIGAAKWEQATGTSGTILALSRLINFEKNIFKTDSGKETLKGISLVKLAEFNSFLAKKNLTERLQLPTMSQQRAEILIAGGQILENTMRALKIKILKPCAAALREGVIVDYLREVEAESLPPVPDTADPRLRGVFAVGRRFGYEESHALQVASLAEKIFDELTPIYKLPRHDRILLSAAALLHNVGYHIAHSEHHKHSLYLIKNSELTGFTEPERSIIANVARYHRGKLPTDKHPDFAVLSDKDKLTVRRLGAILRLANALDRSYSSHVKDVRLTRRARDLFVGISSDADLINEIEVALQRAEMFETAFDCRLVLMRRPLAATV